MHQIFDGHADHGWHQSQLCCCVTDDVCHSLWSTQIDLMISTSIVASGNPQSHSCQRGAWFIEILILKNLALSLAWTSTLCEHNKKWVQRNIQLCLMWHSHFLIFMSCNKAKSVGNIMNLPVLASTHCGSPFQSLGVHSNEVNRQWEEALSINDIMRIELIHHQSQISFCFCSTH